MADRTGLSVSTLRAWERRHAFPVPLRQAGGHRRYTGRDVDDVLDVLRARDAGVRLDAAIAGTRARARASEGSFFAVLRRAAPDLAPVTLTPRVMLGVSRAIEDEVAVRGDGAVLLGSFQDRTAWRASRRRWRQVATRAELVAAFAVLKASRVADGVHEVAVEPSSPLAREWAVVCDAPGFAACLAAVERPSSGGERRFEALWTLVPDLVRQVARSGVALAALEPGPVATRLAAPATADVDVLRSADAVVNRLLAYLR